MDSSSPWPKAGQDIARLEFFLRGYVESCATKIHQLLQHLQLYLQPCTGEIALRHCTPHIESLQVEGEITTAKQKATKPSPSATPIDEAPQLESKRWNITNKLQERSISPIIHPTFAIKGLHVQTGNWCSRRHQGTRPRSPSIVSEK